jgi:hypothetical protein
MCLPSSWLLHLLSEPVTCGASFNPSSTAPTATYVDAGHSQLFGAMWQKDMDVCSNLDPTEFADDRSRLVFKAMPIGCAIHCLAGPWMKERQLAAAGRLTSVEAASGAKKIDIYPKRGCMLDEKRIAVGFTQFS